MKAVVVAAVVMLVVVSQCESLSCNCPNRHLPLEQRGCPVPPGCRGGYVMDPCSCCLECFKVTGEKCGGSFREEGTCAYGLFCNTFALHQPGHNPYTSKQGLCTQIPVSAPAQAYHGGGSYRDTVPAQAYPGGGSYRSTLYPNLHTTSYYNRAPTWGGYPSGQVSTTTRYGGTADQNNQQNFHMYAQQTSTAPVSTTTSYAGGADQNNQQNFHMFAQQTSTARTVGGLTPPSYNWQQFYPQVQQTTTARHDSNVRK